MDSCSLAVACARTTLTDLLDQLSQSLHILRQPPARPVLLDVTLLAKMKSLLCSEVLHSDHYEPAWDCLCLSINTLYGQPQSDTRTTAFTLSICSMKKPCSLLKTTKHPESSSTVCLKDVIVSPHSWATPPSCFNSLWSTSTHHYMNLTFPRKTHRESMDTERRHLKQTRTGKQKSWTTRPHDRL